ncbi:MAG: DUF3050 domain-containing protein [Flavobacteriaceae bacterium]
MNTPIEHLRNVIDPIRQEILNHPAYPQIQTPDDLKVFMQYHIYAVWDFMSLLKTLQNNLTCTSVPWFVVGNAQTRYLINEIVAGEESDLNSQGERMSHFELYLSAMKQSGADTTAIETFIAELKQSGDFDHAFEVSNTPQAARKFVQYTFEVINSQKPHLQSAVFTFGREDLIPGMFMSLIGDIDRNFPDSISEFKYYLERHIEVDGDHHSHLALEMTQQLCGDNPTYWQEAEAAVVKGLQMRQALWDGVHKELIAQRVPV